MTDGSPTIERMEDEIRFYSSKSRRNKRWFHALKTIEILVAAVIPFSTVLSSPGWVTGGLGMLVVVLEGFLGLNQFQNNWITYRSTAEALKHEKYLWLAQAGPYAAATNSTALLAERVESLISRENIRWVSSRDQVCKEEKEETGEQAWST